MAYSRSPPQSMSSHDDWGSAPPNRSYSSSSRSTGHQSGTHSTVSASGRAHSGNTAAYETAARTYYVELKKFLASLLAKEASEGVPPQRVSARQKLSRLNALQFHELAMDVYDEMMRRIADDKQVPFLAVREEFHPRRNQARQKLATLPSSRFKDLASDVYHEIARRYNYVLESDGANRPPVPPVPNINKHESPASKPQASQSTNIIPVKGTINVETVMLTDEEKEYSSTRNIAEDTSINNSSDVHHEQPSRSPQKPSMTTATNGHLSSGSASGSESNFQSLDSLMADLGNMVSNKTPTSANNESSKGLGDKAADILEKVRADYEHQLASATKRCRQLEDEVMALREKRNQESSDGDNGQVQTLQSRLRQLQEEYNRLDDQHRQLQVDYKHQQSAIEGVREEISHLLEQTKLLSSKNNDLQATAEVAEDRARQLNAEVKEWKSKYEKCRMELRTIKATSFERPVLSKQSALQSEFLKPTDDGVISHANVVSYQTSIDELLQTARSSKPSDVLFVMQSIVLTCKLITEQVESCENSSRSTVVTSEKLISLKSQFSTALSNLLTAAKNHARGMGISPVSLLDAAASHLTAVVVDLVKTLGIMKDSRTSQEYETMTFDKGLSNQNTALSKEEAIGNLSELSAYLKTETDHIVKIIQQLLTALRSPDEGKSVAEIITAIVTIVTDIMEICESTFDAPEFPQRQQTTAVLSNLLHSKETLLYIRDNSFSQSPESASAAAKRDLAKEAYEIAKFTKELITICDNLS